MANVKGKSPKAKFLPIKAYAFLIHCHRQKWKWSCKIDWRLSIRESRYEIRDSGAKDSRVEITDSAKESVCQSARLRFTLT